MAAELARCLGLRSRDVGFAGRKDRNAVAVQWFSVPVPLTDSEGLSGDDWTVLSQELSRRKIKRGHLAGNRFRIRARDVAVDASALESRVSEIAAKGVPNYFGPQRFGRGGANLQDALTLGGGYRLPRERRSLALSAARSFLFNEILGQRVAAGTWAELGSGDVANLAGSGSVFAVDPNEDELSIRLAKGDIHPTVPLWGRGSGLSAGDVRDLENAVASQYPKLCQVAMAVAVSHRASRCLPEGLTVKFETSKTIVFEFRLGKGEFATSVLREILQARELSFFPDRLLLTDVRA